MTVELSARRAAAAFETVASPESGSNPVRLGTEFLVNTEAVGTQYMLSPPTALAGGGYLIIWTDYSTGLRTIKAQLFTADDQRAGAEFPIGTAAGEQTRPTVAALPDGRFVVTWTQESADGKEVRARLFDQAGTPAGDQDLILSADATIGWDVRSRATVLESGDIFISWGDEDRIMGSLLSPSGAVLREPFVIASDVIQLTMMEHDIASLEGGGFAIAWIDVADHDSSHRPASSVRVAVYDSTAQLASSGIYGNASATNVEPRISKLPGGGFVVAWTEDVPSTFDENFNRTEASSTVKVHIFGQNGSSVGGSIPMSAGPANQQSGPNLVVLASGDIVVTWRDDSDIKAQIIAPSGAFRGAQILVNTATASAQMDPLVTALPDGGFMITWEDRSEGVGGASGDASSFAIKLQLFAPNGTKIGTEVLVNTLTEGDQLDQQIIVLPDGKFLALWHQYTEPETADASGWEVKGQYFEVIPTNAVAFLDLNGTGEGQDSAIAYTENAAAQALAPAAVLTDANDSHIESATVSIGTGFIAGADALTINATAGGTITGIAYTYDATSGVMRLTGSASLADYQAALRLVGFNSSSDAPGAGRSITWVLNDGGGDSITRTTVVSITEVNDAPVNSVPAGQNGTEDTAILFNTANGNVVSVSDKDAGSGILEVKLEVSRGTLTLGDATGLTSVTGDGTETVTITGTAAALNEALLGLRYLGDLNYHGSDSLKITTSDNGNSGGGAQTAVNQIAITLVTDNTTNGTASNDTLEGTAGPDRLAGGNGDDVYTVTEGDQVVEAAGEGNDTVRTSLGARSANPSINDLYAMPDNVENLIGTASGSQDVRDNALDNSVTMGGGNDFVLLDGGGADKVSGGGGDDYLHFGGTFGTGDVADGGEGFDVLSLLGSGAVVFTADQLVSIDRIAVHGGTNIGAAPRDYALEMADGNVASGADMFILATSLAADETLTFNGSAESDGRFWVYGGAGADSITGGKGDDWTEGGAGSDVLNGGDGKDVMYGGEGADTLDGGAGNDRLFGGVGADVLTGGAGNDWFRYTSAGESNAEGGIDKIADFAGATGGDRIDLSGIDANGNAADGNQAFSWRGVNGQFTNVAGQLRVVERDGSWFAEGDTDGNGVADLVIEIVWSGGGTPNWHPNGNDFLF